MTRITHSFFVHTFALSISFSSSCPQGRYNRGVQVANTFLSFVTNDFSYKINPLTLSSKILIKSHTQIFIKR